MTPLGLVHVVGAASALLTGALVLSLPKGTRQHRYFGRFYVSSMVIVNAAALTLFQQTGLWGPFHVLAVISLATIGAGIVPFLLGYRGSAITERHSYFMAWSYVGLVAAGVGQLTNRIFDFGPLFSVFIPILVVVLVGAVAIHWFRPRALVRHQH